MLQVRIEGKSWVRDNHAFNGGVLYLELNASLVFSNSTLEHNMADNCGAGLYQLDQSVAVFTYASQVTGNTAVSRGGGIECSKNSSLHLIKDTILSGNIADYGGALCLLESCKVSPGSSATVPVGSACWQQLLRGPTFATDTNLSHLESPSVATFKQGVCSSVNA